MTEKLYQIKAGHFTSGLVADIHPKSNDLRIKVAAPIVRYMVGWSINEVEEYCRLKRWEISNVNSVSMS